MTSKEFVLSVAPNSMYVKYGPVHTILCDAAVGYSLVSENAAWEDCQNQIKHVMLLRLSV